MTIKDHISDQWIVVVALFIIGFMTFGIRFSFGVFFKYLQADFFLSRAMTSIIFSVYLSLSALFAMLGGWALDRYGAKKIFTLAGILTGLSLLLTSKVTASWQLFITYSFLLALGTSSIYVNQMSTVSRWFTERRGLALGIVSCGASLGMIVVSPISAYLASNYGWRHSYFFLSFAAFFVIIPCAFLLKKPLPETIGTADIGETNLAEVHSLNLIKAMKVKNFWLLISVLFFLSACIYAVIAHIVPHSIDLGISSIEAASMLSLIGAGSLLGRLVMGRVSDIIGSKRSMLICSLSLFATTLLLVGSSKLWLFYLVTVVFGFSFGGTAPLNAALIGDCFGLRNLALIMGVIEFGWEAGAAIGPAIAGYVFDITKSYSLAFLGGSISALLASVCLFIIRRPKKRI